MKKNNREIKITIITLITLILLMASYKNNIMLMILNLFLCVYTIYECKMSIISLYSLLSNYPLLPCAWQYFYGSGASSLSLQFGLPIQFSYVNYGILIFNYITILVVLFSGFKEKEKNIMVNKYKFSGMWIVIVLIITIASLFIYLPTIPFGHIGDFKSVRGTRLLSGGAWNYVIVAGLIFLSSIEARNKFMNVCIKFTIVFVVFWMIGNFERADIIGFIFIYLVKSNYSIKLNKGNKIKIAIGAVAIVIGLLFIGNIRQNSNLSLNKNSILENLYSSYKSVTNSPTAADVIHIYNTGFYFVKDQGFLKGKTYLNYIVNIVPFGNKTTEYDYSSVLRSYRYNLGGGFFLTEPYINFGFTGIAIYTLLFYCFMICVVKKDTLMNYVYYVFMWCVAFRLQWYGLIYMERSTLEILPLMLLASFIVNRSVIMIKGNKLKNVIKK